MSYHRTVRQGMKWCLGSCGRELPEGAFYRTDRLAYQAGGHCLEVTA